MLESYAPRYLSGHRAGREIGYLAAATPGDHYLVKEGQGANLDTLARLGSWRRMGKLEGGMGCEAGTAVVT